MNTPNAFGFIGVGLFMECVHLMPTVTGVRELWLMTMGIVFLLVGGSVVARVAWDWIAPRMIYPLLVALPSRDEASGRGVPEGQRTVA
ncbi:MAG TPA: hypothetical protein VIO38_09320 [Rariglobus sp.]